MTEFYVVGGRQKPGVGPQVEEWHHYGAGVIVAVDSQSGTMRRCVEYISPADVCAAADDPSILFKTGTLADQRLYVPTQTEVLIYTLPSFELTGYVTLPSFNDVHHVRPGPDGTLFIANTGLDMVLEISLQGTVLREWTTTGERLWSRFSRDVDYRKVLTTKPHRSHPNHVSFFGGDIWATRCDQHDLLCLSSDTAPIPISDRLIHDGLVYGNDIYFTAVNGQVIVLDAVTRQVSRRFDLNVIAGRDTPLGWCRGIEVLDDDLVVVGFSRLRPTKWKENVLWAKKRLGGSGTGLLPTRLALFDLRRGKLCWEIDLEPAGMNVIFSIHRVPSA